MVFFKPCIYLALMLQMTIANTICGQEKKLTKDGVILNYKSKVTAGSDASICTYCQDIKKSKNCNELLLSKSGSKMWLPIKSGPIYNIIKNGSTANYKGLNLIPSNGNKLKQYYTTQDNMVVVLTPLQKINMISVFRMGSKALKGADVLTVFRDSGYDVKKDECKCVEKWQKCYLDYTTDHPDENLDTFLELDCDQTFEACKETCMKIEMEHVGRILTFKKSSAAANFQIAIKN